MSQDSKRGGWNLGKEYEKPEPAPPKRKTKAQPPRENIPVRRDSAPPPPPPDSADAELDTDQRPPRRVAPQYNPNLRELDSGMSHHVRAPRNFREFINHPFTLIGLGFLIIFAVVVASVIGARPPAPASRYIPTPEDSAGAVAIYFENRERVKFGGSLLDVNAPEPQATRHGRLFVSVGQLSNATAAYLKIEESGGLLDITKFDFVPSNIYESPLPEDSISRQYWGVAREDVAAHFSKLGPSAVSRAKSAGVSTVELQEFAARLVSEGLSVMEASHAMHSPDQPLPPTLRGAGTRLIEVQRRMNTERVDEIIGSLFEPPLAESLIALRGQYFRASE